MRGRRAATLAAAVVLAGSGALAARQVGRADPFNPLEPGIWLDAAPRTGDHVTTVREISGHAYLPEGLLSVELYVVRPGDDRSAPLASVRPLVPIGDQPFVFDWDARGLAEGAVEIDVIARGLLRSVEAHVTGVRVGSPPDAPPAPVLRAPIPRTAAPRRAPADRTGVYVGPYDSVLPYRTSAAVEPAPAQPRRLAVAPVATTTTTEAAPWQLLAAGLALLVCTAHVHRALRGPDLKES